MTLLPRSSADITVLAPAPWWTPARYLATIAALSVISALVFCWTLLLRRQVKKQTLLIQTQIEKNAALEERARIAREYHDTLSQGFAGVGYQLKSVANHIGSNPDKAIEKLSTARHMVAHSLDEARHTLMELRNVVPRDSNYLEIFGEAAQNLCESAGIPFETNLSRTPIQLSPQQAHEVQRILLEAVSNAIHHASPTLVIANISHKNETLIAEIVDNGSGFERELLDKSKHRFGLVGMRERAKKLGGDLTIKSLPGDGTTITLNIPATPKK